MTFCNNAVSDNHTSSPRGRTYQDALRLLSLLQSNFSVTSMFNNPAADVAPDSSNKPKPDLNEQAIPEMLFFLKRAGYTPQDLLPLKTIHVSGTKGKGSVTALCTSILTRYPIAGRVGTYTSPHVVSVRERIMLDEKPISQELFAKYFFEVWDRFEASALEAGEEDAGSLSCKPHYFRYLTIMAWHVFLKEGVKSVVMECGIGGEYDSTNVIPAEAVTAAVVTALGIDHVAMLGNTIDQIAWHKAGIFKQSVRAFTLQDADREDYGLAMRVLRARALEKGADLLELTEDYECGALVEEPKLTGSYQYFNRILATAAAREHLVLLGERESLEGYFEEVEGKPLKVPPQFKEGLEAAWLRGRAEVFEDKGQDYHIIWCLDGAHTKESIEGVRDWWVGQHSSEDEKYLLFNQQGRNPEELLRTILEPFKLGNEDEMMRCLEFDMVVCSPNELDVPDHQPPGWRSIQENNCAVVRQLSENTVAKVERSVRGAVDLIRQASQKAENHGRPARVLVTGSFHLVGSVLKYIDPNAED